MEVNQATTLGYWDLDKFSNGVRFFFRIKLLGGRHKEGRSRGTDHDTTSLEDRKGEGWITVDVVLNIEI